MRYQQALLALFLREQDVFLAETVDQARETFLLSDYSPIMYLCSVFTTFLDILQSKFVSALPEEPKTNGCESLKRAQTHTLL